MQGFKYNAGIAGNDHEQDACGSLRPTSMGLPVADGTQGEAETDEPLLGHAEFAADRLYIDIL